MVLSSRRTQLKTINMRKGFTLIELLVAVVIITLLTTVSLASYRNGEKQRRIAIATDGIVSMVSATQNSILSGKQIPSGLTAVSGTPCVNDRTIAKSSIVFTELSVPYLLVKLTDKCGGVFETERYNFPTKIRIKNDGIIPVGCGPATCSVNPASIELNILPPFAKMDFKETGGGVFHSFISVDIVIESEDGSSSETVRIDGVSGRVSNI